MAVNWAKEYKLVGDEMVWYKERSERGVMFENDKGKLVRDFEFSLRKTTTARRPDLIYGMPSATQHRDKKDRKTDEVQAGSLRGVLDYWSPRWWHGSSGKRCWNDFRK